MAEYTLVLSPTTTPFPFSALVTAAYASVTFTFDPETPSAVLKLPGGNEIKEIDEILAILGGLIAKGDSTKASHAAEEMDGF